jgi:hypothetical protein
MIATGVARQRLIKHGAARESQRTPWPGLPGPETLPVECRKFLEQIDLSGGERKQFGHLKYRTNL